MKNPILRNGIYGGAALLVIFTLTYLLSSNIGYDAQEIIGYVSIFISLVFVFIGIRQYRDEIGNGNLTFWKGVMVGILIALIPSIVFGIYNLVYVEYIDPGFMESYYTHTVEQMKASLPAEEFKVKFAKLEAEKEMFSSPLVQFGAMASTVLMMGIIVSVISSFILRK